MAKKNKAAQELGRRGAAKLREKYGPGFWKRIRAGEKPSEDKPAPEEARP